LESDNNKIESILNYPIFSLIDEDQEAEEEERALKGEDPPLLPSKLLSPFQQYSDKLLCRQLAQGDPEKAEHYFTNFPLSTIYEWLAERLASEYRPREKK
jgi:hypothetical protein